MKLRKSQDEDTLPVESAKEEKLKPKGEATTSNNCKTYAEKSVAASTEGDNNPTSHVGRPANVYCMFKGY